MPGPVPVDDLAGFEEDLAAVVADGGTQAPLRICELCVVALPVSGAAITVMTDADHQSLVCASDAVARHLAELQFRLAEGPGIRAFASGRPVLVTDVCDRADERWPLFAQAAARETPARGLSAWPLGAGEVQVGVLDFYRDRPGLLGDDALRGAERAADAAFWSLLRMRGGHVLDGQGAPVAAEPVDGEPDGTSEDWLAGAPLERREVYQAIGMLIAQLGTGADAALARLRAHAFVSDRTLDDVARDVIERRLRFDPETT